jgi:hypothetical protein
MAASPETAAKRSIAGRSQRPARYPATNLALQSPIRSAGRSSTARRRCSGPTLPARARAESEIVVPSAKATASVALISGPERLW